jgi:hypothetical protein
VADRLGYGLSTAACLDVEHVHAIRESGPTTAKAVRMFDGTADPLVPYTGGKVSWLAGGGELWSVEQTLSTSRGEMVADQAAPGTCRASRVRMKRA